MITGFADSLKLSICFATNTDLLFLFLLLLKSFEALGSISYQVLVVCDDLDFFELLFCRCSIAELLEFPICISSSDPIDQPLDLQ